MACKIEFTTTRDGYYTVTGPDGEKLTKEDGSLFQVTSRDECYEGITQHGQDGTYTIHAPERKVGLVIIDDSTQPTPPNEPPSWNRTPTPIFTQGVTDTYNLNQDASDPEETLTYATATASPAWPSNVTLASNGLITSSASASEAITSALLVLANDGVNAVVTSPAFNLNVTGTTSKRWNPGHYIRPQANPFDTSQTDYLNIMSDALSGEAKEIPELKGMMFAVPWGWVNPTGSTFDFGLVDSLVDQAATQGQRVLLMLMHKSFGTDSPTVEAPADLVGEIVSLGGGSRGGHIAKLWEQNVADRYIDCMEAIAARYDNNAAFEGMMTNESTASQANDPGYSTQKYGTQWQRIYTAMAGAFIKANALPQINSLAGQLTNLHEKAFEQRIGLAGPDAKPGIQAWEFFIGRESKPGSSSSEVPPRIYATQLARAITISAASLRANIPADIIDLMQTDQNVTHAMWITQNVQPGSEWSDVKAAIQADPTLHETCPTRYISCET